MRICYETYNITTLQDFQDALLASELELANLKDANREHQYGGAIFHANCPYCNSKLSMPQKMSVNNFMDDIMRIVPSIMATCKKCGPVKIGLKRMEILSEEKSTS